MNRLKFWFASAICLLSFAAVVPAQTASPIRIRLEPYVSNLDSPLFLTNAKDGSKRNFIVQQGGIIKVVPPNSTAAADFLNITPKVLSGGELGLLGLTFHPQFATNGYFFVNYTRTPDFATVIARYKTTSAANTLGDPNSERILLVIPQPFQNHKGGMIEFRTDNGAHNLYIGMGDGGSGNDPGNRAQNINELLGKFLRITPDVSGNNALPAYTIPADNPFVGINGADEIYAVGMRNPFRWSFDRGGDGVLWAADVGQNAIEEVDIIARGRNYGWRVYEGNQCTNIDPALCVPTNYVPPIFQYNNVGSPRCSITGGYVYRGTRGSLPGGSYIYGDYCTGEIFIWNNQQQALLLDTTRNISSFGEDETGELYAVGLGGTVERIARVEEANADFDGDGKSDLSVFRPSNGTWYILNSGNNLVRGVQFGASGDVPTPEDFDGDNLADIAVFRPSNGVWYRLNSSNNTFSGVQFGQAGDAPAASDYDGDGRADITVFRPSNGVWYRLNSSNNQFFAVQFGTLGDQHVPGDYDGDAKTDVAVFRPSNGTWYRLNSAANTFSGVQFGQAGDAPAPGDYDGDGRTDIAVQRQAASQTWHLLRSTDNAAQTVVFGAQGDVQAVADYNGDGRDDIAVFRPSTGVWYTSTDPTNNFGARQFGQNGDLPAPVFDRP